MKKLIAILFLTIAVSCFAGLNPVLQNSATTNQTPIAALATNAQYLVDTEGNSILPPAQSFTLAFPNNLTLSYATALYIPPWGEYTGPPSQANLTFYAFPLGKVGTITNMTFSCFCTVVLAPTTNVCLRFFVTNTTIPAFTLTVTNSGVTNGFVWDNTSSFYSGSFTNWAYFSISNTEPSGPSLLARVIITYQVQ